MGRRGPTKKPTELKLLQGTPGGKHKLNANEPKPPKVKGARPPFKLGADARRVWRHIAQRLEVLGLLTEIDLHALGRYCDIFGRWLKAKKFIDENGESYEVREPLTEEQRADGVTEGALKYIGQFPEVALYKNLLGELNRLEREFGLTPAARAGLNIEARQTKEEEVASKLFG